MNILYIFKSDFLRTLISRTAQRCTSLCDQIMNLLFRSFLIFTKLLSINPLMQDIYLALRELTFPRCSWLNITRILFMHVKNRIVGLCSNRYADHTHLSVDDTKELTCFIGQYVTLRMAFNKFIRWWKQTGFNNTLRRLDPIAEKFQFSVHNGSSCSQHQ